jgi:hypothetical protein
VIQAMTLHCTYVSVIPFSVFELYVDRSQPAVHLLKLLVGMAGIHSHITTSYTLVYTTSHQLTDKDQIILTEAELTTVTLDAVRARSVLDPESAFFKLVYRLPISSYLQSTIVSSSSNLNQHV